MAWQPPEDELDSNVLQQSKPPEDELVKNIPDQWSPPKAELVENTPDQWSPPEDELDNSPTKIKDAGTLQQMKQSGQELTREQERILFDAEDKKDFTQKASEAVTTFVPTAIDIAKQLGTGAGEFLYKGVLKPIDAISQSPEEAEKTLKEAKNTWRSGVSGVFGDIQETSDAVVRFSMFGSSITDKLLGKSNDERFEKYMLREGMRQFAQKVYADDPDNAARLLAENPLLQKLASAAALAQGATPEEAELAKKAYEELVKEQGLTKDEINENVSMLGEMLSPISLPGTNRITNTFAKATGKVTRKAGELALKGVVAPLAKGVAKTAGGLESGIEKIQGASRKIGEYAVGDPDTFVKTATNTIVGPAKLPAKMTRGIATTIGDVASQAGQGRRGMFELAGRAPTSGELTKKLFGPQAMGGKGRARLADWAVRQSNAIIQPAVNGAVLNVALGLPDIETARDLGYSAGVGAGIGAYGGARLMERGGALIDPTTGLAEKIDAIVTPDPSQLRKDEDADIQRFIKTADPTLMSSIDELSNVNNIKSALDLKIKNLEAKKVAQINKDDERRIQDQIDNFAEQRKALDKSTPQTEAEIKRQVQLSFTDAMDLAKTTGAAAGLNNIQVKVLRPDQMEDFYRNLYGKTLTDAESVLQQLVGNPRLSPSEKEMLGLADQTIKQYLQDVAGSSTARGFAISEQTGKPNHLKMQNQTGATVVINGDLVTQMGRDGLNLGRVINHEMQHALSNFQEVRDMIAPIRKELFDQKVINADGTFEVVKKGVIPDSELDKFALQYAAAMDASGGASFLSNFANQDQLRNYMKEEYLSELAGLSGGIQGNLRNNLDSVGRSVVDWIESRTKNGALKRVKEALRNYGVIVDDQGQFSSVIGGELNPEALAMMRQYQRGLRDLNESLVYNSDPIKDEAEIPLTVFSTNRALQQRYKDSEFFEQQQVVKMTTPDGQTQEIVIPPNVKVDSFISDYRFANGQLVDELGNVISLGPDIPLQAMPDGTSLSVDTRIARNADGSPRIISPRESKRRAKKRGEAIRKAIDEAPEDASGVRLEDTGNGNYRGTLSPTQVAAINALPNDLVAPSLKRKIAFFNEILGRKDGSIVEIEYQAAIRDKKYRALQPQMRTEIPFGFQFDKQGNFLMTTMSMSRMHDKANAWAAKRPRNLRLWGGDMTKFWDSVRQYLYNHKQGLQGHIGLNPDLEIAMEMKNRINDLFNVYRKETRDANPERTTLPKRKGQDSRDVVIRSRRMDRINSYDETALAKMPFSYELAVKNYLPAENPLAELQSPEQFAQAMEIDTEIARLAAQGNVEPLELQLHQQDLLHPAEYIDVENGKLRVRSMFDPTQAILEPMESEPEVSASATQFMPAETERYPTSERGMYSGLQKTIDEKVTGKFASPEQLKAIVNNPQNAKAEELKWSGVLGEIDRLAAENSGKVPKDKVMEYLRNEGAVKFKEVTLNKGTAKWIVSDDSTSESYDTLEEAENAKYDWVQNQLDQIDRPNVVQVASDWTIDTIGYDDSDYVIFDDYNNEVEHFDDEESAKERLEEWNSKWFKEKDAYSGKYGIYDYNFEDGYDSKEDLNDEIENELRMEVEDSVEIRQEDEGDSDSTSFKKYQLPGGANYREVVMTMPNKIVEEEAKLKKQIFELNKQQSQFEQQSPEWNEIQKQLRGLIDRQSDLVRIPSSERAGYISSHFPETPNYVAHMRLNERTDAQGNEGLFVEEFQSDRHQAGREKGYLISPKGWTAKQTGKAGSNLTWSVFDAEGNLVTDGMAGDSAESAIEYAFKRESSSVVGKIPDAPFRKDWSIQLFKRALRDAVESDKKWIGWTTGDTQAERYDLSKQVDAIDYSIDEDGLYSASAIKGKNEVFSKEGMELSEVEATFGKELAQKMQENKGKKRETEDGDEYHSLSGLDLKVGGEGMKGFYDQILPKEVGKYIAKMGGKVEKVDSGIMQKGPDIDKGGYTIPSMKDTPIWRVNITPEMAGKVRGGQLQFMPAEQPTKYEPISARIRPLEGISAPTKVVGAKALSLGEIEPPVRGKAMLPDMELTPTISEKPKSSEMIGATTSEKSIQSSDITTSAKPAPDAVIKPFSNALVSSAGLINFLPAFHGTPFDVDKFKLEKIGTGEGAQAYGWGLYFAQARSVGEKYRDALSKFGTKKDPWFAYQVRADLAKGDDWNTAFQKTYSEASDKVKKAMDVWTGPNDVMEPTGNLYKVDLDVKDEDLLDWDKPLSEQSEKVKSLITKIADQLKDKEFRKNASKTQAILARKSYEVVENSGLVGDEDFQEQPMSVFYNDIAQELSKQINTNEDNNVYTLPENTKATSEALFTAGIPGIRYLDGMSRTSASDTNRRDELLKEVPQLRKTLENNPRDWEMRKQFEDWLTASEKELAALEKQIKSAETAPTYNYVVFDENLIKILDKNDKPVQDELPRATGLQFMPAEREEKTKKNKDSLKLKMTKKALTDAALSQESWRDWYKEHQEVLEDFFGDYAELFQEILAVTSQASSVKANVGLALKAFGQLMRGEEFDARLRGQKKGGYLDAVIGNLNAIKNKTDVSGRKISNYKAANEGDVTRVVVDRHIARLLFGVDTPSKSQYDLAEKLLTEIANEIGWEPSQVQAALWAHSIVMSGKKPESYGAYLTKLESTKLKKRELASGLTGNQLTKRIGNLTDSGAGSIESSKGRGRYSPVSEVEINGVKPTGLQFMPARPIGKNEPLPDFETTIIKGITPAKGFQWDKATNVEIDIGGGRKMSFSYDPEYLEVPKFKDLIKELKGQPVILLEADRQRATGGDMGGPLHPFLKSNQVTITGPDGKKYKAVWANMTSTFVSGAKNRLASHGAKYALVHLMDPIAHKSNKRTARTLDKMMRKSKLSQREKEIISLSMQAGIIAGEKSAMSSAITALKRQMSSAKKDPEKIRIINEKINKITKEREDITPKGFYGEIFKAVSSIKKAISNVKTGNWAENSIEKANKKLEKYVNIKEYNELLKNNKSLYISDNIGNTFSDRGSAIGSILSFKFGKFDPSLVMRESSDFREGENLDIVTAVELSQNPDIFALYFGKDPKEEAAMSKAERKARDEMRSNPDFVEHEAYDWVMLGPEKGNNFLVKNPVKPEQIFKKYRETHAGETVVDGSAETVAGAMRKNAGFILRVDEDTQKVLASKKKNK
jgi:hypothetical protein